MEVYEAKVIQKDENCLLEFTLKDKKLEIPLTEDNPNAVKSFFNKLTIELKKGEFEFNLVEQEEKNLYWLVSNEYIKQLNNELHNVYEELVDNELVEK